MLACASGRAAFPVAALGWAVVGALGCEGSVVGSEAPYGAGAAVSGTGGDSTGMTCPSLAFGFPGPGSVGFNAIVATSAAPSGPCYLDVGASAPDMRFLIASNRSITCEQTLPSELLGVGGGEGCTGPIPPTWELCIALPASHLTPSTINLAESNFDKAEEDVNCTAFAEGGGSCPVYGFLPLAQLPPATLTIESVDQSSATFTLDDPTLIVGNGDYTAMLCP
jgi:hypothetical protein